MSSTSSVITLFPPDIELLRGLRVFFLWLFYMLIFGIGSFACIELVYTHTYPSLSCFVPQGGQVWQMQLYLSYFLASYGIQLRGSISQRWEGKI